jgi:hypothetical protein
MLRPRTPGCFDTPSEIRQICKKNTGLGGEPRRQQRSVLGQTAVGTHQINPQLQLVLIGIGLSLELTLQWPA